MNEPEAIVLEMKELEKNPGWERIAQALTLAIEEDIQKLSDINDPVNQRTPEAAIARDRVLIHKSVLEYLKTLPANIIQRHNNEEPIISPVEDIFD